MFANAFQSGFLSIFYSVGSAPLGIWEKSVKNGHIRRIVDEEVKSLVLEIAGTNVATTYITSPIKPRASLGIKLPFLVMVVKNMKKYFTFEIQIIGTVYMETIRVQVHANARIRRIYFSDRLYTEEELPSEYKLFMPLQKAQEKSKGKVKDRPSKDAKDAKAIKTSSSTAQPVKELEEPSGAPPTPVEPDAKEEVEVKVKEIASSVEAAPGDVAPVEDVETDKEGDADAGDAATEGPHPTEATDAGEGDTAEADAESPDEAAAGDEGEAPAAEAPPAEEGEAPAEVAQEPEAGEANPDEAEDA